MAKRTRIIYISLGILLVLIGTGGFLFPFMPLWFSSDLNYLDSVAQATASPSNTVILSASPTPRPINPNYPAIKNRLVIGEVGINMPVFESAKAGVLAKGGWVFPNTSTPDAGGNTVIFGHRFRYLPPISNTFYHLDRIKQGDEFSIQWKGETYTYKVTDIKIIEPTDLSVLAPSDKPIVTLITCAPLFSTKQRLVVVGELVL